MSDLRKAALDALWALEIIAEERLMVTGPQICDKQRAKYAAKDLRAALNKQTLRDAAEQALFLLEGETVYTDRGTPLSTADDERDMVIKALRAALESARSKP
jgi:methionyl-tRNA synthetase